VSVSKEEKKEQQSKRAREKEEQGREGQKKKFPIVTEVVKVRIDCRSQVLLWVEPFF